MFLCPNDSILREFTELDVMITWKGIPEETAPFLNEGCLVLIRIQEHVNNRLKLHIHSYSDIRIHITYFVMNTDFMPQSTDIG